MKALLIICKFLIALIWCFAQSIRDRYDNSFSRSARYLYSIGYSLIPYGSDISTNQYKCTATYYGSLSYSQISNGIAMTFRVIDQALIRYVSISRWAHGGGKVFLAIGKFLMALIWCFTQLISDCYDDSAFTHERSGLLILSWQNQNFLKHWRFV